MATKTKRAPTPKPDKKAAAKWDRGERIPVIEQMDTVLGELIRTFERYRKSGRPEYGPGISVCYTEHDCVTRITCGQLVIPVAKAGVRFRPDPRVVRG